MPSPNATPTPITPPRVALIDPRTGLIDRAWYMFFLSLNNAATAVVDSDTGTNTDSLLASYDAALQTLAQNVDTQPIGQESQIAEIQKQLEAVTLTPALLNSNTLNTNYLDFELDAPRTGQIGRLGWNQTDQTLDVGMDYGVTQQVGLETYARVQNSTGVTIPNGTVVGFAGVGVDNTLQVSPYLANGATPTLYVLGVMTHDLPDTGQKGYCTTWGYVRDVNTSGFTVGDILYASPTVAGAFTNIKPTAPYNVVPVAAVLHVSATVGVIFVRPTIEQQLYYGEFTKTDTQSPAVINTAYALTFNTTQIANGVYVGVTTSEVYVDQAGLYNLAVSVQVTSGNASQKSVRVWLRVNGTTDIPNSARLASITLNAGYVVVTLNAIASLLANDFVEVMYSADNTNTSIATVAATAFAPAAPAAIITITQTEQ
jgi:hypothetical protein